MMRKLAALLVAATAAFPAQAEDMAAAPLETEATADEQGQAAAAPALNSEQRTRYREVFAAIRARDWAGAAARLDGMSEGPLHNYARARLYLAPGSPRVEIAPLLALLSRARELPQADQLARLATSRGAVELPNLPQQQRLVWGGEQPRRGRARNSRNDEIPR